MNAIFELDTDGPKGINEAIAEIYRRAEETLCQRMKPARLAPLKNYSMAIGDAASARVIEKIRSDLASYAAR